eukprot:6193478-Pleurochrysis_carterae.AAC.1
MPIAQFRRKQVNAYEMSIFGNPGHASQALTKATHTRLPYGQKRSRDSLKVISFCARAPVLALST